MNNTSLKIVSFSFIISFLFVVRSMDASGAGVVPYVRYAATGQIYFLLGKDVSRSGWTDFGGTGKADKATAAKEAHEETMGVLAGNDSRGQKILRKPVERASAGKSFFNRKLYDRMSAEITFKGGRHSYRTYFVNVTDKVDAMGGLDEVIRKLNKQRRHWYKEYKNELKKKYLEKLKRDKFAALSVAVKKRYKINSWRQVKIGGIKNFRDVCLPKGFHVKTPYTAYVEKSKFQWFTQGEFEDGLKGRIVHGNRFYRNFSKNINAKIAKQPAFLSTLN